MQPYVILHMGISLDGRIDFGGGSDNPYYELVHQFGVDTDLSGSNTILRGQFPDNPEQIFGTLYDEMLIHVTSFFRQPQLVERAISYPLRTSRLRYQLTLPTATPS